MDKMIYKLNLDSILKENNHGDRDGLFDYYGMKRAFTMDNSELVCKSQKK